MDQETVENEAAEYLLKFNGEIVPSYAPDQIFNSDQCGCKYEIHCARTLPFQGERDTLCSVDSNNATTHSYPVQPLITCQENFVPI